jgi:hypothetical protein
LTLTEFKDIVALILENRQLQELMLINISSWLLLSNQG